jgi:hypothetical protein
MMRWVFGADTKPFRAGLDQMRVETKAFASTVSKQIGGMVGFAALVQGFRTLFVEMDRVQKLALRFGESTDSIQKLGHAANIAGTDMETVARSMVAVTKNANEAANGNKEMAAAFEAVGINASEFVNLPLDQKVLLLARAFENGKGSGQQLAEIMKLLGRGGAELIPLLTQGQEALQGQFDKTRTVFRSTIDAMAAFNDSITTIKQNAMVVGAAIFDGFRLIFGAIGATIGGSIGNIITAFNLIVGLATDAGKVISLALSGDFSGAADAAKSYAGRFGTAFKEIKNNASATASTIKDLFNDVFDKPRTPGSGPVPDIEDIQGKEPERLKVEEERKKLAEEIAKLEEDARVKQLSLAERLLELEKKRAQLDADELFGDDETASLKARKESLEIQKEIKDIREKQAAEEKRLDDEKLSREQQAADNIKKLKEEEAALDREQALAKMSPSERRRALEQERDTEKGRSEFLSDAGDEAGSIEASIRAKQLQDQIDAISNGDMNIPAIIADDLRKIGGGGPAMLADRTPEKETVDVLKQMLIEIKDVNRKTKPEGLPEPF